MEVSSNQRSVRRHYIRCFISLDINTANGVITNCLRNTPMQQRGRFVTNRQDLWAPDIDLG